MSCLGRERIFEHFSRADKMKISILRLNYACEMRYGVLLDIAKRVYAGQWFLFPWDTSTRYGRETPAR